MWYCNCSLSSQSSATTRVLEGTNSCVDCYLLTSTHIGSYLTKRNRLDWSKFLYAWGILLSYHHQYVLKKILLVIPLVIQLVWFNLYIFFLDWTKLYQNIYLPGFQHLFLYYRFHCHKVNGSRSLSLDQVFRIIG